MTAWKNIHKDYKGYVNGVKYVMVLENGVTTYMPFKMAKERKLI